MNNQISQKQALQEAHDQLVAGDAKVIVFKDTFPDLFLKGFEPYKHKLSATPLASEYAGRSSFEVRLK